MTEPALEPPADWIAYPCGMEEGLAMFVVDLGVFESIRTSCGTTLLALEVALEHQHDGFATDAEDEALHRLTGPIEAYAVAHGGRYVGHYTCAGSRYAFFYANFDEATADALVTEGAHAAKREVRFYLEDEPEHDAYFQLLVPDEDDWQVLRDMRVFAALREHGDALTEARRIEHWATFGDEAAARDFGAWATGEGYTVESVEVAPPDSDDEKPDPPRWCTRFSQVEVPAFGRLDTVALRRACDARGGTYDGWECEVVGAADGGGPG